MLAFVLYFFASVSAQPGTVDGSFASQGFLVQDVMAFDQISASTITNDLGIVTFSTSHFSGSTVVVVRKYSPNGVQTVGPVAIVPPAPFLRAEVRDARLYPGGLILVTGCASTRGQFFYWTFAVDEVTCNSTNAFGDNGHVLIPSSGGCINNIVLKESGFFLIGTGLSTPWTPRAMVIAALSNGTVDTTFAQGGVFYHDVDTTVSEGACGLYSGNTLLVFGTRGRGSKYSSVVGFQLALPSGALLNTTYSPQLPVLPPFNNVTAMRNETDPILRNVAFNCARAGNGGTLVFRVQQEQFAVTKYLPQSVVIDTSYGVNGTATISSLVSSRSSPTNLLGVRLPDDTTVVYGTVGTYPFAQVGSQRLTPAGNASSAWVAAAPPGMGNFTEVTSLQAQNQGRLLVMGRSFFPTSQGYVFRSLLDDTATIRPCSVGPQCFCIGDNCATQGDFVPPPNSAPNLINGTALINGNLIGSPQSIIHIIPAPLGQGFIGVGGAVYAGGTTLVIFVNQSGTYPVLNAPVINGDFNLKVQPLGYGPCTEGVPTAVQTATALTVTVVIQRAPGCLTPGEVVGVTIAAVVGGIAAAIAVILLARWLRHRYEVRRKAELKEQDLESLSLPKSPSIPFALGTSDTAADL